MGFPPQGQVTRADFENHKTRHQNGGDDEVDVVGLSGLLAEDQHVLDAEAIAAAKTDALLLNYTEGARVYKSADQTIGNESWTALAFDLEDFDTDDIHDNVTNNTRLTCKTAGKYLVLAAVQWTANTVGYRVIRIKQGGTTTWVSVYLDNTTGYLREMDGACIVDLAVNEYLELEVYQSSGGDLTTDGAGVSFQLCFEMQRIG